MPSILVRAARIRSEMVLPHGQRGLFEDSCGVSVGNYTSQKVVTGKLADWHDWMTNLRVRRRSLRLYERGSDRQTADDEFASRYKRSCSSRPGIRSPLTFPLLRTVQNDGDWLVATANPFRPNEEACYKRLLERFRTEGAKCASREGSLKHVTQGGFGSALHDSLLSIYRSEGPKLTLYGTEWYADLKEQLRAADKQRPRRRSSSKLFPSSVADPEGQVLPKLTPPMLKEIEAALQPTPPGEVLVTGFRLTIARKDMSTLADCQWLNDEVVNFYMNMLAERSSQGGYPKVYAFNTFFYPKLAKEGHAAVKRWTRRVDLFSYDIILIPLHFTMHWCLAAVDLRRRHIAYYDSIGGSSGTPACLNDIEAYLEAESLDKRGCGIDWGPWCKKVVVDLPRQQNGSDCGVFTCQYAECLARDVEIRFGQQHMPYFRRRIVYEILHTKLLS